MSDCGDRFPKRRRGNCVTCCFDRELCVEFEVTFNVDIEDVDVTDVSCPGRRSGRRTPF